MPLSKLTTDQIRKEAEAYADSTHLCDVTFEDSGERQAYIKNQAEDWHELYSCSVESYVAAATAWAIWKEKEVKGLVEALDGIIKEPYGCPMCDSGRLRNEKKQHWDDCPFLIAAKAIEQFEKIEK